MQSTVNKRIIPQSELSQPELVGFVEMLTAKGVQLQDVLN